MAQVASSYFVETSELQQILDRLFLLQPRRFSLATPVIRCQPMPDIASICPQLSAEQRRDIVTRLIKRHGRCAIYVAQGSVTLVRSALSDNGPTIEVRTLPIRTQTFPTIEKFTFTRLWKSRCLQNGIVIGGGLIGVGIVCWICITAHFAINDLSNKRTEQREQPVIQMLDSNRLKTDKDELPASSASAICIAPIDFLHADTPSSTDSVSSTFGEGETCLE